MASSYSALITSEHNTKPDFMAWVDTLCGSAASITASILAIPAAFDLDNAVGAQLDVVGQWVGQARTVNAVLIVGFFGFDDDVAAATFGEEGNISIGGPFYEEGAPFEGSTVLGDTDYRTVLRARIVRNQSHGTLADIENALEFIFGSPAQVADAGTNSLAVTVVNPITPTDQSLLRTLDILPRPAGVAIGSITYAP